MKRIILITLFIMLISILPAVAEADMEWYAITGTWDESDGVITGSGGGNGFYVSNIHVTGTKDFEFECEASGEEAFGFGIAIIADEFAPESYWFCFQVDTLNMNALGFHIQDGVKQWDMQAISITNKDSYILKLSYVANSKTVKFYVDSVLVGEKVVDGFEGYITLKTYECTADFKNITYTGEELITPSPTPEMTPTAEKTEAVPTITPTAVPKEEGNVNIPIIIISSIGIVALAAVITVVVIKKKG